MQGKKVCMHCNRSTTTWWNPKKNISKTGARLNKAVIYKQKRNVNAKRFSVEKRHCQTQASSDDNNDKEPKPLSSIDDLRIPFLILSISVSDFESDFVFVLLFFHCTQTESTNKGVQKTYRYEYTSAHAHEWERNEKTIHLVSLNDVSHVSAVFTPNHNYV